MIVTPPNGNPGIVPPWLQNPKPPAPPVITLPVMPDGWTAKKP